MNSLIVFLTSYGGLISQALSLVAKGIELGPELMAQIKNHYELMEQLVSQKRAPTQEEIDALNASIDADRAILQAPQE